MAMHDLRYHELTEKMIGCAMKETGNGDYNQAINYLRIFKMEVGFSLILGRQACNLNDSSIQ
jgi:hypothetical protein